MTERNQGQGKSKNQEAVMKSLKTHAPMRRREKRSQMSSMIHHTCRSNPNLIYLKWNKKHLNQVRMRPNLRRNKNN